MKTARVSDVMTEAVVFLTADTNIDEAAATLTRHRIHGAPVLGERGRAVGVVSHTDLTDRRRIKDGLTMVEDVMTRIVYAVRANDQAMFAVHLMVQEGIHRALVINEDGSIAGIVAPMDILKALDRGFAILDPERRDAITFVDLRQNPAKP